MDNIILVSVSVILLFFAFVLILLLKPRGVKCNDCKLRYNKNEVLQAFLFNICNNCLAGRVKKKAVPLERRWLRWRK